MNTHIPRPLPQFIRDQLSAPPQRGTGLHNWIFKIARQLHAHRTEEEIIHLLEGVLVDHRAKPGEIADAVYNSKAVAWQPGFSRLIIPSKRWPDADLALRAHVIKEGEGVLGLRGASVHRLDEKVLSSDDFIDMLFPDNPLLCCGANMTSFTTKSRDEWRGHMAGLQFIVPSAMSAMTGTTKDGKTSARCLDNTGPRRFLVVEFDHGVLDEHASILAHLSTKGPLAMVVHSGGKSLHGWFFCAGRTEDSIRKFFAYAVRLGADPATFSRCQQVRMPAGVRDTGALQTVYYFNPKVIR